MSNYTHINHADHYKGWINNLVTSMTISIFNNMKQCKKNINYNVVINAYLQTTLH